MKRPSGEPGRRSGGGCLPDGTGEPIVAHRIQVVKKENRMEKKKAKAAPKKAAEKKREIAVVLRPQVLDAQLEQVAAREAQLPINVGINMQVLIERAIDKMVPLDYLEKLLGLMQSQRAQWAKERFFEDLAAFQSECPIIEKVKEARDTRPGKDDKLLYVYAPYEDIAKVTQPILTRHGFSATVNSVVKEGKMTASCLLHHKDGHTEITPFEVPIGEGTQIMSGMQKVAAARTFARRYAYIDALNLAMKGEDVDHMEDAADPHSQPQARAGVTTNAEGVRQQAPVEQKEAPVSKEVVAAARANFQQMLNRAGQWYDKDVKPMVGPTGKALTKQPPNDDPRGPFTRMFSAEELDKIIASGHAAQDDPKKLENLALDLVVDLGERVAQANGGRIG
jgi:hypothetical protein